MLINSRFNLSIIIFRVMFIAYAISTPKTILYILEVSTLLITYLLLVNK